MKAILSDIHGNLEALQAVLEDIARHPVEAIYCLGDLVGYGPNPRECVERAMQWQVVLMGNFDAALLADPPDLGPTMVIANKTLLWSRSESDHDVPDPGAALRRRTFLATRPLSYREGPLLFVHGSPRNPLNEYVFPEDIENKNKMTRIFAAVDPYCFQGHTHVPGIFTDGLRFFSPAELQDRYRLDGRKTLCNVGSVGQPRDGDGRACYVLLDGETILYRRVEYEVEATIQKMQALDAFDAFLAERLRDAR